MNSFFLAHVGHDDYAETCTSVLLFAGVQPVLFQPDMLHVACIAHFNVRCCAASGTSCPEVYVLHAPRRKFWARSFGVSV